MPLLLTGCSDTQKQTKQHIENARHFVAREKLKSAVIEYRNAIQLEPENDAVIFELAETLVLLKEINKAVRHYELAARINPDNIIAHLRLGQIFLKTGELLKAKNAVSHVIDISPESIEAYHLLSGIQIQERDLDSALGTLEKAAEIAPDNIKTLVSLAQLYIRSDQPHKAEQAYLKAIALDSRLRSPYTALCRLYAARQQWDKIEALLKRVVATPGIKAEKFTDLASFYEGRQQFDLAEANLLAAIEHEPDHTGPLMSLAEFYVRQNKKEKALKVMETARSKNKDTALVETGFAQIYLRYNMIDKAEEAVDRALAQNSEFVDALFQKGRIVMEKNEFSKAIDLFDQVLDIKQVHAPAHYYKALCIERRGGSPRPEEKLFRAAAGMLDDPEKFEKDLVKKNLMAAVLINPGYLEARTKLAEIYILEKNGVKAKQELREIFRIAPPNLKTLALQAGVNLLEGKIKQAENIYQSILDQKPDYLPGHLRLGLLYKSQGERQKALDHFQRALALYPEQTGIARLIVDVLTDQKEFDRAAAVIDQQKQSTAEPLTIAWLLTLKGNVFLKQGRIDMAENAFQEAVETAPDMVPPRIHLAEILMQKNRLDQAMAAYKKVESIKPDHIPALMALGYLSDIRGDLDQAEAYYTKILDIDPGHGLAANNLAYLLTEKGGSLDKALQLARMAREKRPKDPNVIDTMGWVYYHKGSYLTAVSEFEESLKINPDSALACFHMGMVLYRTKDFERSREYLKKALDLDPDFRGADVARKVLN
ncbi:MAG: tetratricopeptide repeat protein [Desulfobacteraceae bacterium]